jgi:hypothetical protein
VTANFNEPATPMTVASQLATQALGEDPLRFAPGRPLSSLAEWFVDSADTKLVVVLPEITKWQSLTDVFSRALAWQGDRDLICVVPQPLKWMVLDRLAWIATPCVVMAFDDGLSLWACPAPSRSQVLDFYRDNLSREKRIEHAIPVEQLDWVTALTDSATIQRCQVAASQSEVTYHLRGLKVLTLRTGRKSLRARVGVQYSRQIVPGRPAQLNVLLDGPMPDAMLKAALAVLAFDARHIEDDELTSPEHRMQMLMRRTEHRQLGLGLGAPLTLREYPACRADGKDGFIDFLAIDPNNRLHVIETKIGHDPSVLIQALDYGIWVRAHEDDIRSKNGWAPRSKESVVCLDLVLASKTRQGTVNDPAVNMYIAAQAEALDQHGPHRLALRVFIAPQIDTDPITLEPLPLKSLWDHAHPHVKKQVSAPRWSDRVVEVLTHKNWPLS